MAQHTVTANHRVLLHTTSSERGIDAMSKLIVTQTYLRSLFDYVESTGQLTWKLRRGSRAAAGNIAGTLKPNGYIAIHLNGQNFYAHRLIWMWAYGVWPDTVDHINHDKQDNRLSNLRSITISENGHNQKLGNRNRSGFIGVSWNAARNNWFSHICVAKQRRYLGSFPTAQDASAAYQAAKLIYHPTSPKQTR